MGKTLCDDDYMLILSSVFSFRWEVP